MPTRDLIQARHDAAFSQQKKFVARVNSNIPPGATVAPYAMLPWELWNGPCAHVLSVVCEFFPAQPWNTMLLAEDEQTRYILDLPIHPGSYPPNLLLSVERHLENFTTEFEQVRKAVGAELSEGRFQSDKFGAAVEQLKTRIIAMANSVAAISLGEKVYERHLLLFGETLGWGHAKAMLKKGR